ncbi:MAG TPA: alpha/beta fold hydrolase [Chthoniobacterales bacterium]|nr:alpha/beta fold hydrolase [Chthoniobacterales bacterium]
MHRKVDGGIKSDLTGIPNVKITVRVLIIALAAIVAVRLTAQTTSESASAPFRQKTHTLHRDVPHKVQIQYLLFLPNGYEKGTERWPLILYLHGGSLRGDDISQMKKWGLTEKVEADPNFPFIVVSPQCHKGEIWTDVDALGAILDEVARTYRVDPDRVYVSGHSMGGRGSLYAAYKMPERFAAVLSLGPVGPITAWAEKLAPIPLWLFHGPNDQFTPLKEVEELVHAIEAAGGHPQLTVLPGRDHYILDVYDRPDLYKWLAQQKKSRTTATKEPGHVAVP